MRMHRLLSYQVGKILCVLYGCPITCLLVEDAITRALNFSVFLSLSTSSHIHQFKEIYCLDSIIMNIIFITDCSLIPHSEIRDRP